MKCSLSYSIIYAILMLERCSKKGKPVQNVVFCDSVILKRNASFLSFTTSLSLLKVSP